MIKKYGIPFLAALVALSASAFTSHTMKGAQTTYTFKYNAASFTQPAVQTNSNWVFGAGTSCGSTQDKACQMEVADTYTHLDGLGRRVLNDAGSGGSIIAISAVLGADNVNYVPNPPTSTGIASATDKP